ncbi:MAG: hypothetical protein ABI266_05340 [Ginsengibacter sp.]
MKKRNLLMSFTLMLGFLCIAFTFDNNGVYWIWANNEHVAIILAVAAIITGVFWFKSTRKLKVDNYKQETECSNGI